ncbi:MAG: hypothetical protein H7145_15725 [Akkermansiaceae bacterium]|nr:hypothetical protein [Armatimonadota bacterium]
MRKRQSVPLPVAAGVAAATLLLGFAAGAVAQSKSRLTILQNTISTDARKIGGRLYVPVADIAKAMGWKLTVAGSAISLQPPKKLVASGGNTSSPEYPMSGAAGEEFGNASYRFKVTNVAEVAEYGRKYTNGIALGGAVNTTASEKLVVIDCVLTNATAEREEFCFSRDRYAENTMLLDKSGESLAPAAIDVAADELNPPGAFALAGANVRFALVFRVPQAWEPKALVYTIVKYRERGLKKGTDVRVNL